MEPTWIAARWQLKYYGEKMPLPRFEAKALWDQFGEELASTPALFYGINIIDINPENLEQFKERSELINERHHLVGFVPHHVSVRDYGGRSGF